MSISLSLFLSFSLCLSLCLVLSLSLCLSLAYFSLALSLANFSEFISGMIENRMNRVVVKLNVGIYTIVQHGCDKFWEKRCFNLSYDGGFTDLSFNAPPPPFLFVKTIEKVIRLCTVLEKKLFDWQF